MSNQQRMYVIKRSGDKEPVYFDRITVRNEQLSHDLNIDPTVVSKKVIEGLYSGIKTEELDTLSAETALYMSTDEPQYEELAKRIIISNIHKKTLKDFSKVTEKLNSLNILNPDYYNFVCENKEALDNIPDYSRDYNYSYFGYKTLEKSYSTKDIYGNVIERPQHILMRVATFIRMPDLDKIKEVYDMMSLKYFTHASPTIFNSGMKCAQLSSCFLLSMNDQLEDMLDCMKYAGLISKFGGGIGINISMIRNKGSRINSTGGHSDGITPFLKVWNSLARYVNQCFTPDTWVYSKEGPKQMKNITTNDYLITIDGSFKKVNKVIVNKVDKEILEVRITNSLFPVKLTKEHELYLIKDQKKITNYNIIKNRLDKQIIKPDFYPASELNINDIVGFPLPTYVSDIEDLNDLDFYKLYGMMLGDGHHCNNGYFEYGITLNNITKLEEQTFVMDYLTKSNIKYWITEQEGCRKIGWYDANNEKIKLNRDMLYDMNNNKRIYESFLHLPENKTLKIVEGLLKTDGSNLKEIYFTNTSLDLIMQLRYLLLRLGVLTSGCVKNNIGKTHTTKSGRVITNKQISYSMRIPKHDKLKSIIKFNKDSEFIKYFEWNGFLWGRIKSIKNINYNGDVYDFNMIDNHNYLTDMGLVHNSGKRKGSIAVYLEPHHPDILDFLTIRKNNTKEEIQCLDLHMALWVPDLFMKRLKEDGYWCFFDPSKVKNLHEVYGDEYEQIYLEAEKNGLYESRIKIKDLWKEILISQMETGEPYIMFKDNVNNKSNQKNIGTIRGSNLCAEIVQYTDNDTIAVCNLASISLPSFVNENTKTFDYNKLAYITKLITQNLNMVIDKNFYPVANSKKSNMDTRPTGIGIQGLADVYQMLDLSWNDDEAREINKNIFAVIYYSAMQESMELSKIFGPYHYFNGSPASKGILQPDMWNVKPVTLDGMLDWDKLRDDIKLHGLRNSLLIAQMPTASTSQILGNNESIEPFTSNMYTRRVLSGDFPIINKHLYKKLKSMNLWTPENVKQIIIDKGSILNLNIPSRVKEIYKTSWELSMKQMILMSSERGAYICQTQSLNCFMADPTMEKLSSMFMYGWEMGLKTGMYYLRRKTKVDAIQFSIMKEDVNEKQSKKSKFVCTDDVCTMCSS